MTTPDEDWKRRRVTIERWSLGKSDGQREATLVICLRYDPGPGPSAASVQIPIDSVVIGDLLDVAGVTELFALPRCNVVALSRLDFGPVCGLESCSDLNEGTTHMMVWR